MPTVAVEQPMLAGRPTAETHLPRLHAELLALISAHAATSKNPLAWPTLLRYVEAAAFEGPEDLLLDDAVGNRNPDRVIGELLEDLVDYGLVLVSHEGLAVTSIGTEALTQPGDGLISHMIAWLENLPNRPAGSVLGP